MKNANKIHSTTLAVTLASALMLGLGAVPAQASERATSASSAESVDTTTRMNRGIALGAASGASPSPTPAQSEPTPPGDSRGVGSVVVAALKQVPGLFKVAVKAANAGRSAFVKMWNTKVPGWIKFIVGNSAASGVYDLIKHLLGA
ncbi:MAG: hypothetical protein JWP75_2241 [Frondihabitans sp.]|nr:hypothetical protein [Frondihabitans sp.]